MSAKVKIGATEVREYEYRGWIIRSTEGTHIGYKLPNSREYAKQAGIGTHRQEKGYEVHYPKSEGGGVKIVKTLKAAEKYIDSYLGD